jgi:hypothetical protein
MADRIWIGPYKPLGTSTQSVPGGGYLNVDASAGLFGGSVLGSLGGQVAEGAAGIATTVSEHLANDNEAVIKAADARLGEAEQMMLFDPQNGYLNTQGQTALTHAPAVLEAYTQAQDRELAQTTDDDQRQMLQSLNERRLADFTTQVKRHTATERQRWYDEAGERRIAQMQTDARLHWSDDALLRRSLGTTRVEVREQATRKGWDATLTEAALRQHTSRILVAAIEGAIERDPDRAQAVRTRYDQHIEAADRAALDALLTEAQTRRRADAASAEILNATPPDDEQPTSQWRLRQAEAITEPAVRAATIRRVLNAAAETQARIRALAEQVLARVLKDSLADPSQIPVREWVTLDAEHRQAIETRLDHNAAGTEPVKNPALVDELATEMTQTPHEFARRDLVPEVAHLPLSQWQRFHAWQAGIWRSDPASEDEVYAIKRGLQLAKKMLPADTPDDEATNVRAALVEDIATRRRVTGKSPSDADIADMLARHVPTESGARHTLEWDPRERPELVPMRFAFPYPDQKDRPGIHRVDTNRMTAPGGAALAELRGLTVVARRAIIDAQRAVADAARRVANAQAAAQAAPAGSAAAAQVLKEIRAWEGAAKEHAELQEWEADLKAAMLGWTYEFSGQRFPPRIAEKNEVAEAAKLGFVPTDDAPIDAQGRRVFVNPRTGEYIVRAIDPRTPGAWELLDADLEWQGFRDYTLKDRYPDPPLKQFFPNAVAMTPAQRHKEKMRQWQRERAAMLAGGVSESDTPPPPEDPDETPEAKAKRKQEAEAKAAADKAEAERARKAYEELARKYNLEADSENSRRLLDNLDTDINEYISKYKKASIRRELDTGMLERRHTVRDILKLPGDVGDTTRKLLKEARFDK